MSDSKYKTVFVETVTVGKGMKFKISVNGDQLSRDMQASIEEMEQQGFEVFSTTPVSGFTGNAINSMIGMMILYKKNEIQ
jgi:hypothetical protein